MINKFTKILLAIFLVTIISIQLAQTVQALDLNSNARISLDNFFECVNDADYDVYNYIDTTNTELYNNIQNYLNSLTINYQIINITEKNNICTIDTRISASGIGWNVSGLTVTFELKKINNEYKITKTNLFDKIGFDNIFLFTSKIFAIVFGILFLIFAIPPIIVVVCIIVYNKKKERDT